MKISFHRHTFLFILSTIIFIGTGIVFAASPGIFGNLFLQEGGVYKFKGTYIVDGTITNTHIAPNSIITRNIANNSIKSSDVNSSQIQLRKSSTGIKCTEGINYAIQSIDSDGTAHCVKVSY